MFGSECQIKMDVYHRSHKAGKSFHRPTQNRPWCEVDLVNIFTGATSVWFSCWSQTVRLPGRLPYTGTVGGEYYDKGEARSVRGCPQLFSYYNIKQQLLLCPQDFLRKDVGVFFL